MHLFRKHEIQYHDTRRKTELKLGYVISETNHIKSDDELTDDEIRTAFEELDVPYLCRFEYRYVGDFERFPLGIEFLTTIGAIDEVEYTT